jgi:ubiquitin carboxyl-terminal hydrolase 36/42
VDNLTKQTTLVHAIFGGVLRSQVLCSSCKYASNTYEACLDLNLEINHAASVCVCVCVRVCVCVCVCV